ncbi:Stk1 family PASTA domain-containing Ser/Thr kinase [Peribacillus deserti]|uniref:Serine/threonine-protein kinase PrkC n=1 Tax=Peribacillus deserti TaxID=673318 RepID=A0A2N5M6Y4_9BACI|nr:Stk1 family PASTA domain-containing Ser/Thr kinase [Peribacillus deserti]PLT30111.1 serine/threonine protein kinase [Peribacillus deserti]
MLIGKRISGRYKVLEMIGGGGMANVYLARDMILEREVALKILRMDFSNDEEFIKRFNREAQSATSLAHPNIVSIYDVGVEDDIYYIVMEYVKGLTLKQYIQRNYPIPVQKALDIMEQITSAISHAHQYGIIHRDIKPQNILIDDLGNVKITDFGIAMALSSTSITQTNAVLGSVHYLSPEQARGGMANKTSDIYSLGIVMFELLTGRLPYSGESAISIALKHLQSNMPSPKRWVPDLPQSVANIVLKASSKDSYYRYPSADEMLEDLRTALSPSRKNEPPFFVPEDQDATKAIPVITKEHTGNDLDETLIMGVDKEPKSEGKPEKKEKKKKEKKDQAKKRKKWPIVLVSTFVFLALLGVLTVTVLPKMMEPKEVKVPDIRGENLADSMSILNDKGFKVGDTIEVEDDEVAVNHVIKTEPKIGSKVKEGSTIDLSVSSGKKQITLTNYEDRNIDDVKPLVEELGFKDPDIKYESNDSPAGTILDQSPEPNMKVAPSDTQLTFTVSSGPEKITLKDLSDYSEQTLNEYAENNGLFIHKQGEEYSDKVEKGHVKSQEPEANTQVDKGSTIKVIISRGKKELPPKTVTKEITIEYNPQVEGQAQEVQVLIQDMNHTMTTPFDKFTITETTKKSYEFTIGPTTEAGYKVIVDNSVSQDKTFTYENAEQE